MKDILSADGKWFWEGSEWIPAPPTSSPTASIDEEANEIDEPRSETPPKPPQRPRKASPAKPPMPPGKAPQPPSKLPAMKLQLASTFAFIRKKKFISGILVSIILFSSVAYFLFGDDDSNEVDLSFGTWHSEFWTEYGEGIALDIYPSMDNPAVLELYLNVITNEGPRDCIQSQVQESEIWRNNGGHSNIPETCSWEIRDKRSSHKFDDPVMAPHIEANGITYRYICSVEYPKECLTFIFSSHTSPTKSGYVLSLIHI